MANERKENRKVNGIVYKVKNIISTNVVELELWTTIKIHPVVNVSKIWLYKLQVKGQKVVPPQLVVIDREKEFKVERILNKRKIQEKDKFLVWWKGYIAKVDT